MPRFLDRFSKKRKVNQISLSVEKSNDATYFYLKREGDKNPLTLPIQLSVSELRQQKTIEQLEILDDLWYEGWLEENKGGYVLKYDYLYQMDREGRKLLGFPEDPTPLSIKLDHTGAIGSNRFNFIIEKNTANWKHIERTGKQIGPFIELPDGKTVLMEEKVFKLEQLIANAPQVKKKEEIIYYVAQVRNMAKQLGIPMNNYLEKQEYLFVNDLDLNVDYDQDEIELKPTYQSTDDIDQDILENLSKNAGIYATGRNNEKIFVNRDVKKKAETLNNVGPIKGVDIPRFIETPEAFLPEIDLDLSKFSERVRELGIKVYRAQPYVHAKETNRGWFDVNVGVDAIDQEGEVAHSFNTNEIQELVEQARHNGEEYIQWNNHWLKVPDNAEDFMDATNKLNEEMDTTQPIDPSKLPYILEIYENVEELEFNQPILEIKQELSDLGVMEEIPPAIFHATLKPFQSDGFVWMKTLNYRRIGGLLADDMGLGKTIQVIAFLSYLRSIDQLTPSLIVVPKTLIENWKNEIAKFAPDLITSILIHLGNERSNNPEQIKKYSIVITTYQTLVRDQLVIGQIDWRAIICDEAQAIKNPTTSSSRAIKALKSKCRLALTGTPVENGLSELWSIMDYVQPGLLGSLRQFREDFIKPFEENEEVPDDIERKLINKISAVYKRRTKQGELGGQLPKKTINVFEVPLGSTQIGLYQEVIDLVQNKMMSGLQAIGELKKLSSHPALVNPNYKTLPSEQVPKLAKTLELVKMISMKGEKVLIFTEYREMQTILRQYIMDEFQINPFIINGMTDRRQMVVDAFNRKPGFDVMILSPKAAGTGLTITSANHVIHYTRWWNPAVENQATDRVYRIGQNKDVTVYLPIVKDLNQELGIATVEEIVHNIIEEKSDLARSVIVPSKKLNLEEEVLKSIRLH